MSRTAFYILFLVLAFPSHLMAQDRQPEMANLLRQDGKIYVVVLVLATIFAGIIAYLIRLDRRISKIEKSNNQ